MPSRKPWRIAYLNSTVHEYLRRTCDGSHPHVSCSWLDAILSQGYTPAICDAIHQSVLDRINAYKLNDKYVNCALIT
ncbi:MAG: hypothetical protein ACKPKO_65515, partial [Candidatus Fonsibacter sp.]